MLPSLSFRSRGLILVALTLTTLACTGPAIAAITLTPTPSPPGTPLVAPTITPYLSPTDTHTTQPLDLPTPFPTSTPQPTPTPETAWLPGEVRVFPGPLHYEGDVLSVELPVANMGSLADTAAPRIVLDGQLLDGATFERLRGTDRRSVLLFRWVWDSTGQEGRHELTISVPVNGGGQTLEVAAVVDILPANRRPLAEQNAIWQATEEFCCRIYTITQTAAARDGALIAATARDSVAAVEERLGFSLAEKPLRIVVLDNVWGDGVYTGNEIGISYLDRDYMETDLSTAIQQEVARQAARSLNTRVPVLLSEGMAVYIAGGHIQPEPLSDRAAALLELGAYVPLATLADDFHGQQHEAAHLEAGALVDYLAETYTWSQFVTLYSLRLDESGQDWLDRGFKLVYGIGLAQVEDSFIRWLSQQPAEAQLDDVRLTLAAFDTARLYQMLYAPYQQRLPDLNAALERGITADFVRESTAPENIALETMLLAVRQSIRDGRYIAGEELIAALTLTIQDGNFTRVPVSDYLSITRLLLDAGYEPQRIILAGEHATVEAIRDWPVLETLDVSKISGVWQITD